MHQTNHHFPHNGSIKHCKNKLIKCQRKFKMTVEMLELEPVKLHQYFDVSIGEYERILQRSALLSSASWLLSRTESQRLWCSTSWLFRQLAPKEQDFTFWPEVQKLAFHLRTFRHRSKYIFSTFSLCENLPPVCMFSLTSISFKIRWIVHLPNLLQVCKDLKDGGDNVRVWRCVGAEVQRFKWSVLFVGWCKLFMDFLSWPKAHCSTGGQKAEWPMIRDQILVASYFFTTVNWFSICVAVSATRCNHQL